MRVILKTVMLYWLTMASSTLHADTTEQPRTVYIISSYLVSGEQNSVDLKSSTVGPTLRTIPIGIEVLELQHVGDYVLIRLSNGEQGWVHDSSISPFPPQNIVALDNEADTDSIEIVDQMYACPTNGKYLSVSYADGNNLHPYSETIRGAEIELDASEGVKTFNGIEYVYAYVFVSQNADGTYRTAEGWVKRSEVSSSCN